MPQRLQTSGACRWLGIGAVAGIVTLACAAAMSVRRNARLGPAAALFLLLHGSGAAAPTNIGDTPNAAYLEAIRGLDLQAEIIYLPPNEPLDLAEPLAAQPKPAPPASPQILRWLLIAIAAAALSLLAALVLRNSSGGRAIFARPLDRERGHGAAQPPPTAVAAAPAPGFRLLAELAALSDRRQALQRLTEYTLDRATRANGIRLGRSQTARDVLAFLSPGWRHIGALNLIVRTEEAVRFGGAPLADGVFADCLAAVRPLFAEHGAA